MNSGRQNTYFKITGWGWHHFSSILNEYSRYIITWKLFNSMSAVNDQELLDQAIAKTGATQVKFRHRRPRLLSDVVLSKLYNTLDVWESIL